MELIVVLVIAAIIVWWFVLRKTKEVTETTPEAPYKVEPETPRSGIDPVAIALDLEPMVISKPNTLDVNKDGKVDLKDAAEVVKKTRTRVKKAADVDGDGRVTVKDAKAAVKKVTKARKTRSKKA